MKLTNLIYKSGIALWNVFPFRRSCALFLRYIHFPVGSLSCDLWFEGPFSIPFAGKTLRLVSQREDKGSLEIFWKGLDKSWDAQSIKIWGELAKDATVVFDIGANMGLYSIAAKAVNLSCEVYAFEPSRKIIKTLEKNVAANNFEVSIVPIALSNEVGEAVFYDLNTFTATASLKPNEYIVSSSEAVSYKVSVTTLQRFVDEHKISQIDLISIDVEMNEPEVLAGMGELIEKYKPNFIIEVLNNEVGSRIEKYFENTEYQFFAINEKSGLTKTEHLSRDSSLANPSNSFNFLVCSIAVAEKLGI